MRAYMLLPLVLVGCSNPQFATEYRVGIDQHFTKEWQDAIVEAVGDWQSKIGEDQIHFTITYAACNEDDGDRLICIHPASDAYALANQPDALGWTDGFQDGSASSDVWIKISALTNPVPRKMVILHEIGHGLGLVHLDQLTPPVSGAHIMAAYVNNASTDLTCEDVRQYLSYRSFTSVKNDLCENAKVAESVSVPVLVGNWD